MAEKSAPKPAAARPRARCSATPAAAPAETAPAPAAVAPLVTNAAYVQNETPLGLRYALVQVVNAAEREVSPQSTFHSGDMVRVKIEGNRNGYLYVIARGSSGNWKPLFPSLRHQRRRKPRSAAPALHSAFRSQAFTFDEQPGEERLFLIYSVEPIPDIGSMFPSLVQPAQADKPAARPPSSLPAPRPSPTASSRKCGRAIHAT